MVILTVEVKKDPFRNEAEIIVRTPLDRLDSILAALSLAGETIAGKTDGRTVFAPLSSIYYFESVDERLFFCTEDETCVCPARLKQIEERLSDSPFARVSKTVIVNLDRVHSIRPEKNSRLIATMTNGEKLIVSRQYVRSIKDKLGV